MKIIIKQGIKACFSSKWRTILFSILVAISSLFFNLSIIFLRSISNNVDNIPKAVLFDKGANILDKKFSDKDISSVISPFNLIDDERIEYNFNDQVKMLPTISVGYDSNFSDGYLNFITDNDIEVKQDNGVWKVSNINFSVNKNSHHFKNSVLYKEIIKNDAELNSSKIKKLLNLINEIFSSAQCPFQQNILSDINYSLNISKIISNNSMVFDSNSDSIIKKIKDYVKDFINPNSKDLNGDRKWVFKSTDDEIINTMNIDKKSDSLISLYDSVNNKNLFFEKDLSNSENHIFGYNGQIGSFQKANYLNKETDNTSSIIYFTTLKQYLADEKNVKDNNFNNCFMDFTFTLDSIADYDYNKDNFNKFIKYNFDNFNQSFISKNIYKISSDIELSSYFYNLYFKLLGYENNLNVMRREQLVIWNISTNKRFKFINISDSIFNNNLSIITATDDFDSSRMGKDQVLVSPGFLLENNLKLGDLLDTGYKKLFISGIATDSYNVFPTIGNSDFIPNSENDAVVYCSPEFIFNYSKDDKSGESAKELYLFFQNKKGDIKTNLDNFKNDIFISKDFDIYNDFDDFSSITTFYNGATIINKAELVLSIVIYFFAVLFLILCIVVSIFVIRDIIDSQKVVIGNLKANGFKFIELCVPYLIYISSILIVFITVGFGISIGISLVCLKFFEGFFSIGFNIVVDVWFFAIIFAIMSLFVISSLLLFLWIKMGVKPLVLINGQQKSSNRSEQNKNYVQKHRTKSFNSKLIFAMLKQSYGKLFVFCGLFFISTFILIISSVGSVFFINYANNKFVSYNYSSRSSYNNLTIGTPFNQLRAFKTTKSDSDENINDFGFLPKYVYAKDSSKPTSLIAYVNSLKTSNSDNRIKFIQECLLSGIKSTYNKKMSLNYFSHITNNLIGGYDAPIGSQDRSSYIQMSEYISQLLGVLIPKAFSLNEVNYEKFPTAESRNKSTLKEAYLDVWQGILRNIIDKKVHDSSKSLIEGDNNILNNFNFSFNLTPTDSLTPSTYTYAKGVLEKHNLETSIIGQTKNKTGYDANMSLLSKEQDLDNNIDVLESAHYKYYHQKEKHITLKIKENIIQYRKNEKEDSWNDFSDYKNEGDAQWSYVDSADKKLKNLYELKDKALAANNPKLDSKNNSILNGLIFSDNEDINEKRYINVNDIVLKIKKTDIDSDYWNKMFKRVYVNKLDNFNMKMFFPNEPSDSVKIYDSSQENVNLIELNSKDDSYYIRPFSYDFSVKADEQDPTNISDTWYDAAIKIGFIKVNQFDKSINLNIVGSYNDYENDNFIANQLKLNKLLKVSDSTDWFNGLYSDQSIPDDVRLGYSLNNVNGSISTNSISDYSKLVDSSDYISLKKEIIRKLLNVVLGVAIIIYVLLIFSLVISLSFIIKVFVYQFKEFILVLRAIGYDMKTINKVILWQLLPFATIGWALASAITLLIVNDLIKKVTIAHGMLIPIGNGVSLIPITFALISIILYVTYTVIISYIKKIKLTQITN